MKPEMRTTNCADGYITPGDVPATYFSWLQHKGRTAHFNVAYWTLFDADDTVARGKTLAEATAWVLNCPMYIARCEAAAKELEAKPEPPKPKRFAEADLSLWCQRYEGEPVRHVRGATSIVPLGFDPAELAVNQGCRKARLGSKGWYLYKGDGDSPSGYPSQQTEAVAIRWVEDGLLPHQKG